MAVRPFQSRLWVSEATMYGVEATLDYLNETAALFGTAAANDIYDVLYTHNSLDNVIDANIAPSGVVDSTFAQHAGKIIIHSLTPRARRSYPTSMFAGTWYISDDQVQKDRFCQLFEHMIPTEHIAVIEESHLVIGERDLDGSYVLTTGVDIYYPDVDDLGKDPALVKLENALPCDGILTIKSIRQYLDRSTEFDRIVSQLA